MTAKTPFDSKPRDENRVLEISISIDRRRIPCSAGPDFFDSFALIESTTAEIEPISFFFDVGFDDIDFGFEDLVNLEDFEPFEAAKSLRSLSYTRA